MLGNAELMGSCTMCPYWVHVVQSDVNWVLHIKGTFQDVTKNFGVFSPHRSSRIGEEEAGGVDG